MSNNERRKACREVLQTLLSREEVSLEKLKVRVCSKYGLKKIPTNADVLAEATDLERERILPKLRLKPVRSLSGINVIAVMSKPDPCPHGRCVYCPSIDNVPNSYTGREPSTMRGMQNEYDAYRQVSSRLDQLRRIGHSVGKVELIVQGGTFPATPLVYQRTFVKRCLDAITGEDSRSLAEAKWKAERSKIKNVGITFETRPDYAKEKQIDDMLEMGVTKVEVGVQNVYDEIYRLVERGHTLRDVTDATRLLKDAGLKVCYHMMPGLPGSTYKRDLDGFHTIFKNNAFKPDMLKIYPCLVLKESKLYDWWNEGKYSAYTTEEATHLIAEVKTFLPSWVRIMRVQRDIPAQLILDGVKKSNLRQIVFENLKAQGVRCRCIRCREVGHRFMRDGVEPNLSSVELTVQRYEASGGIEYFIAFEDVEKDVLVGFLRLRIPSKKAHRPEITLGETSLVRELHVYGPLVPVGRYVSGSWQHQGYGKALLREAERISRDVFGFKNILVTSALGSRNYFNLQGYTLHGPYMAKALQN
jgi:elongator complex protein 3